MRTRERLGHNGHVLLQEPEVRQLVEIAALGQQAQHHALAKFRDQGGDTDGEVVLHHLCGKAPVLGQALFAGIHVSLQLHVDHQAVQGRRERKHRTQNTVHPQQHRTAARRGRQVNIRRAFAHSQVKHVLQQASGAVGTIHVGFELADLALDQTCRRVLGKVIVLLDGLCNAVELALKEMATLAQLALNKLGHSVWLRVAQHHLDQTFVVFPHGQETVRQAQRSVEDARYRCIGLWHFVGVDKAQPALASELTRDLIGTCETQLHQKVAHGHLLDLLLLQHVVDGDCRHKASIDQCSAQGRTLVTQHRQAILGRRACGLQLARGL